MIFDFPNFDPVLIQIGPFAIRWYALAYIIGILLGWWLARFFLKKPCLWKERQPPYAPEVMDDFVSWATLGIILGGRSGYVLFYDFADYSRDPLAILRIWEGGMSFHGGTIGLVLAIVFFAHLRKLPLLSHADIISSVAPIGIFFGRIANFINGELWGRPTDGSWGMIFPMAGDIPRHPSQLYEAGLEGLLLFSILMLAVYKGGFKRPGLISGLFLFGYGLARFSVEYFREPDVQLGLLTGGLSMGQWLCLPMMLAGLYLIVLAKRSWP